MALRVCMLIDIALCDRVMRRCRLSGAVDSLVG